MTECCIITHFMMSQQPSGTKGNPVMCGVRHLWNNRKCVCLWSACADQGCALDAWQQVLLAGNNKTNTDALNKCDVNAIAGPDNVFYTNGNLLIAEDTPLHFNNYLWAYNLQTGENAVYVWNLQALEKRMSPAWTKGVRMVVGLAVPTLTGTRRLHSKLLTSHQGACTHHPAACRKSSLHSLAPSCGRTLAVSVAVFSSY